MTDQGKQQTSQPEQFIRDEQGNITAAKIKVQGEEREIPLNELLELAQKGDDYTKKTQALSEKEKRLEEETRRKAEELAEQYLTQLAEEQPQQPQQSQTQEPLDPQEKRIANLEAEIAKMKQGTEETRVAQYELQFEKQLAECKTKYPNMDEKVILATLSANPQLNMEELAKESHEGKEKERDEWIKKYLADKGKQPKETGGGPTSPPITPSKELTAKDLARGNVKRAAIDFIRQQQE